MPRFVSLSLAGAAFALVFATLAAAQTAPLYSIDGTEGPPTDEETAYLELINRARSAPPAEGTRLRTTTDPDIVATIAFFRTDLPLLEQEFSSIPAAAPLAFNGRLLNAARLHSRDQFNNQFQGHVGSNGSTLTTRLAAAGYAFATAAENVYIAASSVLHGHASFEIDWGNDAGGMQTGRGHRVAIHNPDLREIGVGIVNGTNGAAGPQVVTQDFGTQPGGPALLTGVAYCDLNGDNFYSMGEGLGEITVTVGNANFSARTAPSGAFTIPLPGNGTYNVRFTGLGIDESTNVAVSGGRNVKADLRRQFAPPSLTGSATPAARQPTTYRVANVPGASRYEFVAYQRSSSTPMETAENTTRVTLATSPGYDVVQSSIRATGSAAFNLRVVPGARNQTITLNRLFLGRPGAMLTFGSRLGSASSSETARVQASTDGGQTWADVYSQVGAGPTGETAFSTKTVNLSALEGKIFRLRLLHAFTSGTFFTGSGAIGWYIDDIRLPNCEELTVETTNDLGAATTFAFTPAAMRESYLLQVTAYNGSHRLGSSEPLFATSVESSGSSGNTAFLTNLSVRTGAGTGAQTLIVGFAVSGGTKPLLVRGVGPGLTTFGVANVLTDPRLELFSGATKVAENDNWEASAAPTFVAVGAFGLANGSRDAALVTSLSVGTYTAQLSGVGGATGTTLVELYDTAAGAGPARLTNVSARSQVGASSEILIAGFTIGGTGTRRLLIRAVGPTLTPFGVTGVLVDPKLELFTGASKLNENDNWNAADAGTFTAVGAFNLPTGSRDAVLLVDLPPGSYTAQVSGAGGSTGVALVEIYEVP